MTVPVAEAVDRIVDRVGSHLVVGTPLGIGKPLPLLDALYRRARQDPDIRLDILTALTLTPPHPRSELERRLLEPVAARMDGLHTPAYAADRQAGRLPDNVTVSEFYSAPGALAGVDEAQRSHIDANYTDVVRDCLDRGINVVAQSLATDAAGRLSLASNSDITLELLAGMAEADRPTVAAGMVNERLPFLEGDAVVEPDQFDVLADSERREPFPVPAEPVSLTDHAVGLLAAALVPDGGTIQLGIGSMADAVASALILRHTDPATFGRALEALGSKRHSVPVATLGGTEPFRRGLYGCSEMLSDALLALYDAGILRRRAFPHPDVQRLADQGALDFTDAAAMVVTLHETDVIASPLRGDDLAVLAGLGVIGPGCRLVDAETIELPDGSLISSRIGPDTPGELAATAPGEPPDAPVLHAAFYVGSSRFYERLRSLTPPRLRDINMTGVAFTNTLGRAPELMRTQRHRARFVNQAMKVGATGTVSAHVLGSGRTLSGVGGQFDFVEMARRLPDGRSITMIRSTHGTGRSEEANIVPSLPYPTIPGQHRDLVVTEYGIADLQGRTEGEMLEELIGVSDVRFQKQLVDFGRETGRIDRRYRPGEQARTNRPERIGRALGPFRDEGHLPEFPFGSDLTDVEAGVRKALLWLDGVRRLRRLPSGESVRAAWSPPAAAQPYLERMGLADPGGMTETSLQRALCAGLVAAGVIEGS